MTDDIKFHDPKTGDLWLLRQDDEAEDCFMLERWMEKARKPVNEDDEADDYLILPKSVARALFGMETVPTREDDE